MGVFIDLHGRRFGRLIVTARAHSVGRRGTFWSCTCDCGNVKIVYGPNLRNGLTQSCGCLQRERCAAAAKTHGWTGSAEYYAWSDMLSRCGCVTDKHYGLYGGRGVTVCARWLTFENFLADMGPRPSTKHSLDRTDNDGDYEPANCRWATKKVQANNTRRNLYITIEGETYTLAEWCERLAVPYQRAWARLKILKWSPERALELVHE